MVSSSDADKPGRGRFAPSPTGPLHFGSLVAATASYLDARSRGGEWLLRMEDLDEPRNVPGAADAILRDMEAFGFAWNGPVVYQSHRLDHYREALEILRGRGYLYGCACTRREIADSTPAIDGAHRYPGTCRRGLLSGRSARAFRVRVEAGEVHFEDRLLGCLSQNVAEAVGDFVLLRADGQFAYQLAVVVDDAEQGVSEVVRGADLLDSTARQIYLQNLLGLPMPRYLHVPVAVNAAGEKLSKQTLAPAIDATRPQATLVAALGFLGHAPPHELRAGKLSEIWSWALANWNPVRIARVRQLPAPPFPA